MPRLMIIQTSLKIVVYADLHCGHANFHEFFLPFVIDACGYLNVFSSKRKSILLNWSQILQLCISEFIVCRLKWKIHCNFLCLYVQSA